MKEPQDVVLAFIADYFRWNQAAYEQLQAAGRSEARQRAAMDTSLEEGNQLLGSYFVPGSPDAQQVTFGYPSNHQPDREVVTSVKTTGERSVVKTRLTQLFGSVEMKMDHTFRLRRVEGHWRIESIKRKVAGDKGAGGE
jgi:hypothetical protein